MKEVLEQSIHYFQLPPLQIQRLLANPSSLSASKIGPDQGYFVDTDILERVPILLICCGVIYGCILAVGALLLLLLQVRHRLIMPIPFCMKLRKIAKNGPSSPP